MKKNGRSPFFRKKLFSSFLAELGQNKQIWVKKIFGAKTFSTILHYDFDPAGDV